jgi:DNA replication protein DnaC
MIAGLHNGCYTPPNSTEGENRMASDPNPDLCSVCGGSGYEPVEGKGVRVCECRRNARPQMLLLKAKIPARYLDCGFDNFVPTCPSVQRALMLSKRYVEQYPIVDGGLLFIGTCGTGKTHLATAILAGLIKKGIPGLFYDFRDLLKEIQDSYNPSTHTSEQKILRPVFDAEVLVLDELGAGKPTEWIQETITHIITKRYNDKRTTLFTSNYQDIPIGSAYTETLTDRIGVRLRSRLREMCKMVLIEGDDYRDKVRDRQGRLV